MLTLARGQSPAVSIDGEAEPKEGSQDGDLDVGVTSVALSPDGTFIAVVRWGWVLVYQRETYARNSSLQGSLDRGVRIWNSRTGTFISKLSGHSNSVYSLAFSADGKTLVSGSLDSTLRLWDLSEHVPGDTADGFKCRSVLAGHKVRENGGVLLLADGLYRSSVITLPGLRAFGGPFTKA